ncbi:general stress protein [Microbispora sp. NPDC004025]
MSVPRTAGPHKVVLATYSGYDAAQHAVDVLARHDFPIAHVTIVGCDLRWEEKVLGRWGLGRALVTGAGTGGWIGLLIGLMFAIFSPWAGWAIGSSIVLGLIFGVVWGAISHVVRHRAFASMPAVVADHYDILVDPEFADEARRVLTHAREAAALR